MKKHNITLEDLEITDYTDYEHGDGLFYEYYIYLNGKYLTRITYDIEFGEHPNDLNSDLQEYLDGYNLGLYDEE